jgi:hypothetical protein
MGTEYIGVTELNIPINNTVFKNKVLKLMINILFYHTYNIYFNSFISIYK